MYQLALSRLSHEQNYTFSIVKNAVHTVQEMYIQPIQKVNSQDALFPRPKGCCRRGFWMVRPRAMPLLYSVDVSGEGRQGVARSAGFIKSESGGFQILATL